MLDSMPAPRGDQAWRVAVIVSSGAAPIQLIRDGDRAWLRRFEFFTLL